MRDALQAYEPTEIQIRNLQRYAACTAWQAAQALTQERGQWDAAVRRIAELEQAPARRRARRRDA